MGAIDPINNHKPFGGKIVVFGGDFRPIIPVVPKRSRQDIIDATINASKIWNACTVLRLTKNMRLKSIVYSNEREELTKFASWIMSIEDGTIRGMNDRSATTYIPNDILSEPSDDPIAKIVENKYSMFKNATVDPNYLKGRSILAPTLDVVIYMSSLNESDGRTYLSSDSTCKLDTDTDFLFDLRTPEFLKSIKCFGLPNHEVHLKMGTTIMLMRSIDHSIGLCNGTRLVVTKLSTHVLECNVLTGSHEGEKVLIPQMTLTSCNARIPFKFQQRQFSLIIS